jgi:hypothetical protein
MNHDFLVPVANRAHVHVNQAIIVTVMHASMSTHAGAAAGSIYIGNEDTYVRKLHRIDRSPVRVCSLPMASSELRRNCDTELSLGCRGGGLTVTVTELQVRTTTHAASPRPP